MPRSRRHKKQGHRRPVPGTGREFYALPERRSSEDGPIFDALELAPVAIIDSDGTEESFDDLVDIPEELLDTVFWSVFGHTAGEGLWCIGDFQTYDDALEVIRRLTGRLRDLW